MRIEAIIISLLLVSCGGEYAGTNPPFLTEAEKTIVTSALDEYDQTTYSRHTFDIEKIKERLEL